MPESILQPPWLEAQGRKEGRYVIGPLLGHGAMGDVHEAWDTVLARPVALKILKHLEPAAMIRFMHEAQLHARVDIPNICRIYDVDANNGTPRIAMQLVRGPTLEDAAQDLRLEELLRILIVVAEAVHGAHQHNLIHRDIKPSNILLQWSESTGWAPFLCDFGLAMALDGPTLTQPLALTGTPAYMAPEQVRGDRALVGPPTDVYGLGSTLYFTLVGRPPCVSTTTSEMLRVKRERRFPSPRSLEPEIPPALEAVLLKCMEPAPEDRYATAAELAEALRGVLAILEGAPAPRPGLKDRIGAWVGGRRRLLALLGAGLCLGSTLPALACYFRRQHVREGEMAQVIALEASSLEQSIRNERLLPAHDLRAADSRTRERMAALRSGTGALGPGAAGAVAVALGRAHFLLGDLPAAKAELDRARNAGFQTPEAALLMAQVQQRVQQSLTAQAAFQGAPPPAQALEAAAQAGQLLQQARMQTSHPREFAEALNGLLRGNLVQAAQAARAALQANPWDLESAILGSQCLTRLARERLEAGDAGGAEARCREALDLARDALVRGQSEPRLHHAACAAALGLAALAMDSGTLAPAGLADLERDTRQALRLDPGNPDAQTDWLQARALEAMRLLGLGRDPRPVLDEALRFYWTQTREPRSLDLRVDHMVLYWLQAEAESLRGADPGPSLTEALKDMGHAVNRWRDYQGDLLNLKAQFEAARGQDPRPTVEAVVTRFAPAGPPRDGSLCEITAKAWLIRAEWEVRNRIDALDSIRRAQTLLKPALDGRPGAARAHALQGLSDVLESRSRPDQRNALIASANEHLRWSARLNPADRDLARLRDLMARH